MIKGTWLQIRHAAEARNLPLQWTQDDNSYTISLVDGTFTMVHIMPFSTPPSSDQFDFESNFKANGNKTPAVVTSAMAAKTLGTKNLFKRVVGVQCDATVGENTIMYTVSFPWAKLMSIEVIGGEVGDTCSLYVLDSEDGMYSGVPSLQLNQFGFSANISPAFYTQKSEFDADVYEGLQIKIIYTSMSAKKIGINFVMNEVK